VKILQAKKAAVHKAPASDALADDFAELAITAEMDRSSQKLLAYGLGHKALMHRRAVAKALMVAPVEVVPAERLSQYNVLRKVATERKPKAAAEPTAQAIMLTHSVAPQTRAVAPEKTAVKVAPPATAEATPAVKPTAEAEVAVVSVTETAAAVVGTEEARAVPDDSRERDAGKSTTPVLVLATLVAQLVLLLGYLYVWQETGQETLPVCTPVSECPDVSSPSCVSTLSHVARLVRHVVGQK